MFIGVPNPVIGYFSFVFCKLSNLWRKPRDENTSVYFSRFLHFYCLFLFPT
uniref:Uncharacterized protein n=1 Tax=Anguilla anguilla TaxID=7936 RepID=A0A0E9QP71_ANGAN